MSKRDREGTLDKERCLAYVRRLWDMDKLGMFHHPVSATDLPDYNKIVKYPIDLSTIRQKIDSGAYGSDSDVQNDVALMISNALEYNPKGSEWHMQARTFRSAYLDLASQSGLSVDADAAYIPSKTFRDDESTIRKAEKHSEENINTVLKDLETEKEIPIEELMARYKRTEDPKKDENGGDSGSDEEEEQEEEEEEEGEEDSSEDDSSEDSFEDSDEDADDSASDDSD